MGRAKELRKGRGRKKKERGRRGRGKIGNGKEKRESRNRLPKGENEISSKVKSETEGSCVS